MFCASWILVGASCYLSVIVVETYRIKSESAVTAPALLRANIDIDLRCAVSGNTCSVKGLPSSQVTCTASAPTCCCSYEDGRYAVNAVKNSSHCVASSATKQVISQTCWRQEEQRPVIRLAFSFALCVGVLLCVAASFRRQSDGSTGSSWDGFSMCVLTFAAYFGGLLHYTIIIPEAYSFATSLHRDAADSGSLIGSAFLFTALVLVVSQPCHSSSLSCIRAVCAFSFGGRCLGAVLFYIGANPATALSFSRSARYHVCIVGRMLGGACQGFSPLFVCAAKQIMPPADHVSLGSMVKAAATLGLGLGPLTSNLINYHIAFSTTAEERSANPFLALVILNITLCILTLLIFPVRSDIAEDSQRAVVDDKNTETIESGKRRGDATLKAEHGSVHSHHANMWMSAIVFDCERSFTLASLEAGVAFILEYYVGWTTEAAGYACSTMCVAVVPFLLLQFSLRDNANRDMVTLQVCGICAVALPLLMEFPRVSTNTTVMLFICTLMFLFACIAGGICNGYAYKVSGRAGYFSVGNFMIVSGCLNGASRCVAPPVSRWLLHDYGVSAYAAMLLISGLVGAIALLPFRNMSSSDMSSSDGSRCSAERFDA